MSSSGDSRGTFWAGLVDGVGKAPGTKAKRNRTWGILVRGERAAYEMVEGVELRGHRAMRRVVGELRLDGIEEDPTRPGSPRGRRGAIHLQARPVWSQPSASARRGDPGVRRSSRSSPLIENVDEAEPEAVTSGARRLLSKIAREFNQVIDENLRDTDHNEDDSSRAPPRTRRDEQPRPVRVVEEGIAFARGELRLETGESRGVPVWFDATAVPPRTPVVSDGGRGQGQVAGTILSGNVVPKADDADGVAGLSLAVIAGDEEGAGRTSSSPRTASRPCCRSTCGSLDREGFISRIDFSKRISSAARSGTARRVWSRCGPAEPSSSQQEDEPARPDSAIRWRSRSTSSWSPRAFARPSCGRLHTAKSLRGGTTSSTASPTTRATSGTSSTSSRTSITASGRGSTDTCRDDHHRGNLG